MKTKFVYIIMAAVCLVFAAACSEDDNLLPADGQQLTVLVVNNDADRLAGELKNHTHIDSELSVARLAEGRAEDAALLDRCDYILIATMTRDEGGRLDRVWNDRLKALRDKCILILDASEETVDESIVPFIGLSVGNGIYVRDLGEGGNVYFADPEAGGLAVAARHIQTLKSEVSADPGTRKPQETVLTMNLNMLCEGQSSNTTNPQYKMTYKPFSVNSYMSNYISTILSATVHVYTVPDSEDRFVEVDVDGSGFQTSVIFNEGSVNDHFYHTGNAYLLNLIRQYSIEIGARADGTPHIYSMLPRNELSSATISNSESFSFSFKVARNSELGFSYRKSKSVSYQQKEFQTTVTTSLAGEKESMGVRWLVRPSFIYKGNPAWYVNDLYVEPLTKSWLPAGSPDPFTVYPSNLPNLYRAFNPSMTAVFYTTAEKIGIDLTAGVEFQNSKVYYLAGCRNSISSDVHSCGHTVSLDIVFPKGSTQTLLD